jgi:hypothetical protein
MYVELERMDEFERELREAMERQPAPPGLKRRVMEQRGARRAQVHGAWWQKLAATIVLADALGGAFAWRNAEQRRRGEEAKQQVFTALRITNRALQQMNEQLKERNRDAQ